MTIREIAVMDMTPRRPGAEHNRRAPLALAMPEPSPAPVAHPQCHSCGLPIRAGLAHAGEAQCVEALRIEIQILKAFRRKDPRETAA